MESANRRFFNSPTVYKHRNLLAHAVAERSSANMNCSPDLLAHISPLGWVHILLTGEYRWPKRS